MIVNIVCDEANAGWVYSSFIKKIKDLSQHDILVNEKDISKYDVLHFMPYYLVDARAKQKPSTCWMSHMEAKNPMKGKFLSSAKTVDVAISHSNKYAKWLRAQGLHNVIQVMPGVDPDKFKFSNKDEKMSGEKLKVGYIGRHYSSSNRKNPVLLDKISKLDFVEFKITGGNIASKDIPEFYSNLDVVISPASIEGGPMAVTESLMVGTPILCFRGVGVADDFDIGVIKLDSDKEMEMALRSMYDNRIIGISHKIFLKKHVHDVNFPNFTREVRKKMRERVEGYTWKKFVIDGHDKNWDMITSSAWRKSKGQFYGKAY